MGVACVACATNLAAQSVPSDRLIRDGDAAAEFNEVGSLIGLWPNLDRDVDQLFNSFWALKFDGGRDVLVTSSAGFYTEDATGDTLTITYATFGIPDDVLVSSEWVVSELPDSASVMLSSTLTVTNNSSVGFSLDAFKYVDVDLVSDPSVLNPETFDNANFNGSDAIVYSHALDSRYSAEHTATGFDRWEVDDWLTLRGDVIRSGDLANRKQFPDTIDGDVASAFQWQDRPLSPGATESFNSSFVVTIPEPASIALLLPAMLTLKRRRA